MKKSKRLLIGFVLTIMVCGVKAQDAVPASGGNSTGAGGTVSYSIGQIVYTTDTGTNGSVTKGVQQPYEISVITGVATHLKLNLSCKVYPNPASSILTLEVENLDKENLSCQLYDIKGKLLEIKSVEGRETNILLDNLPAATYLLNVVQINHSSQPIEIKSFKIIKH